MYTKIWSVVAVLMLGLAGGGGSQQLEEMHPIYDSGWLLMLPGGITLMHGLRGLPTDIHFEVHFDAGIVPLEEQPKMAMPYNEVEGMHIGVYDEKSITLWNMTGREQMVHLVMRR